MRLFDAWGQGDLRDWQRSKVYRGESDWSEGGRRFESLEEIRVYGEDLLAAHRVTLPGPDWLHRGALHVYDGRGSSSARACGGNGIALPHWARCERVVLHEIAHVVIWRRGWQRWAASHGAEFVRVFLDLVQFKLGFAEREKLANCLRKRRVRWDRSDLQRWKPEIRAEWVLWAERNEITLPG